MGVSVGMDVHRNRSQIAIIDAAGAQQRNRNLANDPAQLAPVLGALPPGTPVAVEAADGWGWLVELLEELELAPHLVHPSRCKAIAAARLQERQGGRGHPGPTGCGPICCPRPGSRPRPPAICGPCCATGPGGDRLRAEILARMAVDPAYSGTPLTSFERAVVGQHRLALRQDRLAFAWVDHRDRMPTPESLP